MSIVLRSAARVELSDLLTGIAAADPAAAARVEANVRRTLELLEAHPLSGSRVKVPNPNVKELRGTTVRRYPQFVILYLPLSDGVEVLHIIRGRRNIRRVVAND
ncbi:MAG: type II toxin-antitoxin system RelE/ParE family toxin [Gemmataceae bacterium]|nr:type II toxin-antitoxin system RelE/ParE family toxin [Gemmataceae bacterium]